jgi:hypothetical protein
MAQVFLSGWENKTLYAARHLDLYQFNSDGTGNVTYGAIGRGTQLNTTGNGVVDGANVTFLQIQNNVWISYGQLSNAATSKSNISSQNDLSDLLNYNYIILQNNLLCSRMIEAGGSNIPQKSRQKLFDLQNRLMARNSQLRQTEITYEERDATMQMQHYSDTLSRFMNNYLSGVGAVPIILIVIAIVAIAASATTWAVIKSLRKEAKVDFTYSNELVSDLKKYLPAEIYNQLMQENSANEDRAREAIAAASNAKWKNYGIFAVGIGVLFGIKNLTKK